VNFTNAPQAVQGRHKHIQDKETWKDEFEEMASNEVVRVERQQPSSNQVKNTCPYEHTAAERKKKVSMVRVIVRYKDADGDMDSVSKECCVEHAEEAEEELCRQLK